jgi:hypothetical protein
MPITVVPQAEYDIGLGLYSAKYLSKYEWKKILLREE